jgi:hypothetical protein
MDSRARLTFALLIAAQAAHSIEESVYRLYDVFPPARFVSGLISNDRPFGFISINVVLVAFGAVCVAQVWRGRWRDVMWLWVVVEMMNGVVHSTFSIVRGGYTPGVATAPILLLLAITLARQLSTPAFSRP